LSKRGDVRLAKAAAPERYREIMRNRALGKAAKGWRLGPYDSIYPPEDTSLRSALRNALAQGFATVESLDGVVRPIAEYLDALQGDGPLGCAWDFISDGMKVVLWQQPGDPEVPVCNVRRDPPQSEVERINREMLGTPGIHQIGDVDSRLQAVLSQAEQSPEAFATGVMQAFGGSGGRPLDEGQK